MRITYSVCFHLITAGHEPVPLYRYRNPNIWDHFYTTDAVAPQGYHYIDIACYIYNTPQDGLVPLFCYWSEDAHDHYYTTTDERAVTRGNQIYKKKALVGYVPSQSNFTRKPADYNIVPLFQYWNDEDNDHFYSTENDAPPGYVRECEVCQVLT